MEGLQNKAFYWLYDETDEQRLAREQDEKKKKEEENKTKVNEVSIMEAVKNTFKEMNVSEMIKEAISEQLKTTKGEVKEETNEEKDKTEKVEAIGKEEMMQMFKEVFEDREREQEQIKKAKEVGIAVDKDGKYSVEDVAVAIQKAKEEAKQELINSGKYIDKSNVEKVKEAAQTLTPKADEVGEEDKTRLDKAKAFINRYRGKSLS